MVDAHERLVRAVAEKNGAEVRRLIENGIDLNVRVDQGASILFGAILIGDENVIRLMLEHGADPNQIAHEPAATIYTDKPLNLARQARFLIDWDKYDPIVKLLELFGATDFERQVESESEANLAEARARQWQARKTAPKSAVVNSHP